MSKLYRIQNPNSTSGLWYSEDGNPTDFIKSVPGYRNAELPMGFEEQMAGGWHSATENIEQLKQWFNFDEMDAMEERGYRIYEFDVDSYKIGKSETGIEHAVFQRDAVIGGYHQLSRAVLL